MNTKPIKHITRYLLLCTALGLILGVNTGCVSNPVTGRSELGFVGQGQEIAIGQQHYTKSQQAQGGDLVTFPEVTAYVQNIGDKLAKVSDRPDLPYEFVVLNNGVPNAWALPGGKIAVNRGLLVELETESELAAVLAHEIVHAAARHGAKSMERGMLIQTALAAGSVALADHDYRDLILTGANASAVLGTMKYGRNAEFEADKYGVKYMVAAGYDPQGAVSVQQKFMAMQENQNPSWLGGMLASHPPSSARVERNRALAKDYENGVVGREAYQRAMQPLFKSEEAYKKLEEGKKALTQNNPDLALDLADQAIRIEPREAHFHGLAAKALAQHGRVNEARRSVQSAIAKNDNYFEFYLQEAQLEEARGNTNQAKLAYEKSLRLLPTATAHHALGVIAQQAGDSRKAIAHHRAAAASNTPAGQKSREILTGVDMKTNPQRYVQPQLSVNRSGRLDLTVKNASQMPIKNIAVRVQVGNQSRTLRIPGLIPGGQSLTVATGFGPYKDPNALKGQAAARVISATTIQ